MIGVLVGVEHRIHFGGSGAKQLQSQLGRSIDEERRSPHLDQRGGAGALVPGIGRAAHRAAAPDLGHAERGAGAQEGEPHAR
jgi:hypothetical protein